MRKLNRLHSIFLIGHQKYKASYLGARCPGLRRVSRVVNQSGALIICLFVYCCGLVFAPFLLILPQIQCANFAILKHFQRGFGEPSYIYQIHKIIAKKQVMMANLS